VFEVLSWNRRDNDSIWSRIAQYSPVQLHNYLLFKEFGPRVMEQAEFAWRAKRAEREYYSVLARGLVGRKGQPFWTMHREGLSSLGLTIDRSRVCRTAVREILRALADPRRVARALKTVLQARPGRPRLSHKGDAA
jgi:hypothetical protein